VVIASSATREKSFQSASSRQNSDKNKKKIIKDRYAIGNDRMAIKKILLCKKTWCLYRIRLAPRKRLPDPDSVPPQ
jgi:hypothetical protein